VAQRRNVFLVLFTVSGFSGLIYESIWTHYLKLFLGHAAYAQSLVLAIFMGGLSLGSWISSRYSGRWNNLFRSYALAEAAIGILALLFHPLFISSTSWSFDVVIPALPSLAGVNAYKWTLAALLILPQSVLLGMTFPLLSAAMIRAYPDSPGRSLALLYFTNSIGAAVGVLASGFLLIRVFGLPGTIATAGVINLVIAVAVWMLAPGQQPGYPAESLGEREGGPGAGTGRRFLLIASLVTGAASFIYEIGWIRMLSLVLGSSTHAFELMLSAFILGLALGGLWVQRRIEHLDSPVRFLSAVQIVMGLSALATLLLYGSAFGAMQWIVAKISKTDAGYLLFNLSSNGVAIAIMLPATFCAGMTLPLITYILLKRGAGESSIGSVYAMNTIGAIAGVFFAIHAGMPLLGVKGLITAGAVLDMGLGLLLLAWSVRTSGGGRLALPATAAVCLCAAVATAVFVPLDRYSMASGVYRLGRILEPRESQIVFYKDGKTASVSVVEHHERGQTFRSIRTNGKPDATLGTGIPRRARPDEPTMVLAAALPLAYHPGARTVANIGFGSGLTSHTVLLDPAVALLDTIEIEREMVEGARHFGRLNSLVYEDPRSRITIDDAKTFFSSHKRNYDIIISEPSNPWVSGVAGLFSDEFYRLIGRHLNRNGVFVQWVQLYEIDMNLVASVFKALSPHFSDFVVYTSNASDMIIVAAKEGELTGSVPALFSNPRMAEALSGVHIRGPQDIETRKIGSKALLMPLFELYHLPANSDYDPVLDQNAARARFLGTNALEMVRLAGEPLPVGEMLSGTARADSAATSVTRSPFHPKTEAVHTATALRDFFLRRPNDLDGPYRGYAEEVVKMFSRCGGAGDPDRRKALFDTAKSSIPYLTPAESAVIWKQLESGGCQAGFTSVEKSYVALFKAIGARNGKQMTREANYLLEHEPDITPARSKYVLAAGLLGYIAERDRQGAEALLRSYRDRKPGAEDFFLLRFLTAQMRSGS